MSAKLKISLIANIVAIICLISLGIVTFFFVKSTMIDDTIIVQTNYLKTSKDLMNDFKDSTEKSLKNLSQTILKYSAYDLRDENNILVSLGKELKAFRDAGNFLAVYIGVPNGELVTSDPRSDEKQHSAFIFGKVNNYDATTRSWYKGAKEKMIFLYQIYTLIMLPIFLVSLIPSHYIKMVNL